MNENQEKPLDLKVAIKVMLKIVTFDEPEFHKALGLDTDKTDTLQKIIAKALTDNKSYTTAIEDISNQVANINELALCIFYLGTHAGTHKSSYLEEVPTPVKRKTLINKTKGVVITSTTIPPVIG
jgi:hypothetical protein